MFKFGDKVYSFKYGWGEVVEISIIAVNFPVVVKFKNDTVVYYTQCGVQAEDIEYGNRTLFFEEIPIPKSALERPRKSAEEMLDECDEVMFKKDLKERKYYLIYGITGNVCYKYDIGCRTIGIKYISEEDAERIVKECKENNI